MTLRALRVNYSLSLEEVADCLEIHPNILLKYEEDSSDIPIHLANDLAAYYGVSLDSIFLGKATDLKQKFKEYKRKDSCKD
ncbi:DNA-binding helix-turn-helix protein [Streptococcus macacae NCTC 11558]|uniref:DNA-binding helix-turn-helix protein n=1 Tax=Streptococcus macacae NCTC 11558 TaxID=764298 RepID=G5JUM0_9STRE|nr:DNA-binding helix-turn-helix protein [Streptococcus macacae NCTC 11558]